RRMTRSYAASRTYRDASGRQEVDAGSLPPGFVAIDLARALGLPLFDPDRQVTVDGQRVYQPVDPTLEQPTDAVRVRPATGHGLIGGAGRIAAPTDAKVVVAANGGSDLIYVPDHDPALLRRIVDFLVTQDYTGGLFVDDAYGEIPGTLPLSAIQLLIYVPDHDPALLRRIVDFLVTQDYTGGLFVDDAYGEIPGTLPLSAIQLRGSASLPVPAIVLGFRTFATDP